MDCRTYRTLFSEFHDERLRGEARTALVNHLERCTACAAEWKAYHRIFALVPKVEDLGPARPFQKPREAPAALRARAFGVRSQWERLRTAAAVILLLGISHVAVFEWARRGGDDLGEPLEPLGSGASAPFRPAGLQDAAFAEQVDATALFVRQLYQMPDVTGPEGMQFVNANVQLLEDGRKRLARVGAPRAPKSMRDFLGSWDAFSDRMTSDPALDPKRASRANIRLVRRIAENTGLTRTLEPVRQAVASETPRTNPAWARRASRCAPSREVKPLFDGQVGLLAGDYAKAVNSLEHFRRKNTVRELESLSLYLQAEAYRRQGDMSKVLGMVRERPRLVVRRLRPPTHDPIAEFVFIIHDASVGGNRVARLSKTSPPLLDDEALGRWCRSENLTREWGQLPASPATPRPLPILVLRHEDDVLAVDAQNEALYGEAVRAACPWLPRLPASAEPRFRALIRPSADHPGLAIDVRAIHRILEKPRESTAPRAVEKLRPER